MTTLKDVVNGLEIKAQTRAEDTRFSSDRLIIEEGELSDYTLLPLSLEYGEAFLAFTIDNEPELITISSSNYMGVETNSYFSQALTLQGVAWCLKYLVGELTEGRKDVLNSYFKSILKENNLDIEPQEAGSLAVYNSQFGVYILQFETDFLKYWITFSVEDGFYILKKITSKNIGCKVKAKSKKLNLLII